MGIGKYFHKKKEGEGNSPQQPRRFRSRRGSADLGTSPYDAAQAGGRPEQGSYPLRGNYSSTAVGNPKTRSRTSSLTSRFRRPTSYAGPPGNGHGDAPFLPEPQMSTFQTNEILDGSNYPPSPYNGYRQPPSTGLEGGMNNMNLTDRQVPDADHRDQRQTLPINSSPQAPRADHVSPTGATMRKIEPESSLRRQAPTYQPQMTTHTTTTSTVTTSYPRGIPPQQTSQNNHHRPLQVDPQYNNQRDSSVKQNSPQQFYQPDRRNIQQRYSHYSEPDNDVDYLQNISREKRPYDYQGSSQRSPRYVEPVDDRYSQQAGSQYADKEPTIDRRLDGPYPRSDERARAPNGVNNNFAGRNRKKSVEFAPDDLVRRTNSISRKPVETSTSLPQRLAKAPQSNPAGSPVYASKISSDFGPRADSAGAPTGQQVMAGAKSNTYDTIVAEKIAPAVVHETVNKKVKHVREEQISKEIHTHDVFHRILPIVDVEVLPTRHFLPVEGGGLVEISADEVPGRAKHWVVAETASKITSDQPAPKAVDRFTACDFPGTEGDFEKSIAPEGYEQTKTTWVHHPTLETGAQETGQTWPFEFGDRPKSRSGSQPATPDTSRAHKKKSSRSRMRAPDSVGSQTTGYGPRASIPA